MGNVSVKRGVGLVLKRQRGRVLRLEKAVCVKDEG